MSLVKKTINVTDTQEAWIRAQIDSGHYGNDSELFRDLIRREQTRAAEIDVIRAALIEAEQSGPSSAMPEDIRTRVQTRLRHNGVLSSDT
jgi:antitoxin ParD1/3/4